jgi:chemotaxis response regulator CheB
MLRITQDIHKSSVSNSQVIKILLVDDQKFVRHELEQILYSKAELKIVGTASDGKEAIALVESLRPDVLLIELEMPGINAIEAASIFLSMSLHRNTRSKKWFCHI